MGTGRGRSGSFSLWREGFGGLGHCCGGVLCIFRLLSLKRSLPCAPHPPASLGLRLSRNFSDKVSREPQDPPPPPPPPPSPNMRKGLSGKLRARARLCICVCACHCASGMCARAVMGGAILTMKGTGFSPPPPTSLRCASALGQLPWPLRSGAGLKRPSRYSARLRTGSSSARCLFHAACASV